MQITSSKTANILCVSTISSKLGLTNCMILCAADLFLICRQNIPMLCDNQNPIAGCDRPFLYIP